MAGILSLSELGGKHEAFVVPATTIRKYVIELLVARQISVSEHIGLDSLRPILEAIGASNVPVTEIPSRLKQFVDAAQARAREPVRPSNNDADIDVDAAIGAARARLGDLDSAGARSILAAKIAEEEALRRRLLPLLEEQAAIEQLSYDYEAAKATLARWLVVLLAGTWHGEGFNLVARPNFEDNANLFLELNLTREILKFDPISSSIPIRGVAQPDIELFGLTYRQQINDATTGGALHMEQGIWVTQPATTRPPLSPPSGAELVARMANIPKGSSFLAQGTAINFSGPPTISPGPQPISGGHPAFSCFPSFNSTPFTPIFPGSPIFAAGNSELHSAPGGGFSQYTLTNAASATNTRTPFRNAPAVPLSAAITQDLVNDPIIFLQQTILQQIADGYAFEGIALNIATESTITFNTQPVRLPTNPTSLTGAVHLLACGGGIENLSFLQTNADVALVYATFWVEKLTHPNRPSFMQLQYAQTVLLNFPAINIPGQPNFSWPHVSVATLRKSLG